MTTNLLHSSQPQKAKAKAKAKAKSKVKTDKISKSALQKEQARQRAKKADEQPLQALVEEAIPKPKAKAKSQGGYCVQGEVFQMPKNVLRPREKRPPQTLGNLVGESNGS